VHLLVRIMSSESVVGAAYLIGKLYVITENSSGVLVYTGHSPYTSVRTISMHGMIAVDIATNYAAVCLYVLDNGNGRVSRIDRKHNVTPSLMVWNLGTCSVCQ